MTTEWDWKEWDDQHDETVEAGSVPPTPLYMEEAASIADQLVKCFNPDCLNVAEVVLEGQWTPTVWEQVDVCVAHIPYAEHCLLEHTDHEGTPAVIAIQLHPFPSN